MFESMGLKDELAARNQSSIFNCLEKKWCTHFIKFLLRFPKIWMSNLIYFLP